MGVLTSAEAATLAGFQQPIGSSFAVPQTELKTVGWIIDVLEIKEHKLNTLMKSPKNHKLPHPELPGWTTQPNMSDNKVSIT